MKGLVFFKDGHTEDIVEVERLEKDVYFETDSACYTRITSRLGFGYSYCVAEKNGNVHNVRVTHDIERIDIFD